MSERTHRRRISVSTTNTAREASPISPASLEVGITTAVPADRGRVEHLTTIPGTPRQMSTSRSPSPRFSGSWIHGNATQFSDRKPYGSLNGDSSIWPRSTRNTQIDAYASGKKGGFLRRHLRGLSLSLPVFDVSHSKDHPDKEQHAVERAYKWTRNAVIFAIKLAWKLRPLIVLILGIVLLVQVYYRTSLHEIYRRKYLLGGGNKFVIMVGANVGGGVMEWKGPRDWAIERDSLKNKRKYAARWGYNLQIIDLATKKRYAHEWRESWEKVDTIRRMMRDYPEAEWFWWLDLNTFIMEPSIPLQKHIFNNLGRNTYRDINEHNPLNITHPFSEPWLDPLSRSLEGDGDPASINLLLPQDCSGFNLGTFFVRRSEWTYRLLDIWWDPVLYEQKHMQWEHKEQDALENLYTTHPWIRSHTAFLPQRKISSFPPGACGEDNPEVHYSEKDRDFMINLAGCEWGRDCWKEIWTYRRLSNSLNRTPWEKFKDGINDSIKDFFAQFKAKPEEV